MRSEERDEAFDILDADRGRQLRDRACRCEAAELDELDEGRAAGAACGHRRVDVIALRGTGGRWWHTRGRSMERPRSAAAATRTTSVPAATVATVRSRFPVLETAAYLDAARAGLLSRGTLAEIEARFRLELHHGRAAREQAAEVERLRASVRESLGAVVGARAENIALVRGVGEGIHLVFAGLGLDAGAEVVTTNGEHAAVVVAARAAGVSLRVVPLGGAAPHELVDRLVRAVGPRTRLVVVSEVMRADGAVVDVRALADRVRVPLLVDGAQAVGAIRVDVSCADYYAFTAAKWLCGPEAVSALYVRDPGAIRVAEPSVFGYVDTRWPLAALEPRSGAARLDPGVVPAPLLAGAARALAELPPWHLEQSREVAVVARSLLAERLGLRALADASPIVAFRAPGAEQALEAARVRATVFRRAGIVRLACGYWSTAADVERAVDALAAARRAGGEAG